MKTRQIEMGVCFGDGSWNTHLVDIPADTSDDKIEMAGQGVLLKQGGLNDVAGIFLYNSMDDEVEEEDEEAELL